MIGTAVIRLEEVGMTLAGSNTPLFAGVNLAVAAGEIVGIVGPNGVGKTTLLNVASLLLRPSKGRVLFDNASELTEEVVAQGHGMNALMPGQVARSFQRVPMIEGIPAWRYAADWNLHRLASLRGPVGQMTAFAAAPVLALISGRYRRQRDTLRDSVRARLGRLGLDGMVAEQSVDALSMGARRLVDVLRALTTSTTLFVLDEPFANLRHETAVALGVELRRRAEDGVAGLVADHSADLLQSVAQRVFRLTKTGLVPA